MACLLAISGCVISRPSENSKDQNSKDLKEKTADATAALKKDSKDMAVGIREGWNRDKALDLNRATKEQLLTLPGMTPQTSDKVIAGRPYDSADQLVDRRILTQAQYEKIKDKVVAKR